MSRSPIQLLALCGQAPVPLAFAPAVVMGTTRATTGPGPRTSTDKPVIPETLEAEAGGLYMGPFLEPC